MYCHHDTGKEEGRTLDELTREGARRMLVSALEVPGAARRDTRRRSRLLVVRKGQDERLCTLVLIGARADGQKELTAVEDGDRQNAESLKTVLRDLKRRGVQVLGRGRCGAFSEAMREVCGLRRANNAIWVPQDAQVLDKPPSVQGHAKP